MRAIDLVLFVVLVVVVSLGGWQEVNRREPRDPCEGQCTPRTP